MDATYPLAPQGVFSTVQGECSLSGLPMTFIRLAGCNVGCSECDTDYSVHSKKTAKEIVREVVNVSTPATKWVWVTGGEPTIHNLDSLLTLLHQSGFRVALATAGVATVQRGAKYDIVGGVLDSRAGFDFVSVSPHRIDDKFVQRRGDQVNLVFGLNGLTPNECEPVRPELEEGFTDWWVTPVEGSQKNLDECLKWVYNHKGWRLNCQAHKLWKLP